MQPWMHNVPEAIIKARETLRTQIPDLQERFTRIDQNVRDKVAAVKGEQTAGGVA